MPLGAQLGILAFAAYVNVSISRARNWARIVALVLTELEVGITYPDRADWLAIASDSLVEVDRLETLARDLRALLGSGYAIQSITLADLFPQTFHLETVVHLRRS